VVVITSSSRSVVVNDFDHDDLLAQHDPDNLAVSTNEIASEPRQPEVQLHHIKKG